MRKDKKVTGSTNKPLTLAACSSLLALAACDSQGNFDENAFMGAMIIGGIASEASGNSVNWDALSGAGSSGTSRSSGTGRNCDGSPCGGGSCAIQ